MNKFHRFAIQEDHPTGHCVALVRGAERTLLAHPGAAEHFGLGDLESSGILRTLKTSRGEDHIVVYVEGFFAIHSWDVTVRLAEVSFRLGMRITDSSSNRLVEDELADGSHCSGEECSKTQ